MTSIATSSFACHVPSPDVVHLASKTMDSVMVDLAQPLSALHPRQVDSSLVIQHPSPEHERIDLSYEATTSTSGRAHLSNDHDRLLRIAQAPVQIAEAAALRAEGQASVQLCAAQSHILSLALTNNRVKYPCNIGIAIQEVQGSYEAAQERSPTPESFDQDFSESSSPLQENSSASLGHSGSLVQEDADSRGGADSQSEGSRTLQKPLQYRTGHTSSAREAALTAAVKERRRRQLLPKIAKEDRCGVCHHCLNPKLKKACITARKKQMKSLDGRAPSAVQTCQQQSQQQSHSTTPTKGSTKQ